MIRQSKSLMIWPLLSPSVGFEGHLRRLFRPHVEVRITLSRRLLRAQVLLIRGQRQARALGELRDPPVQELAVVGDEVERPEPRAEPADVGQHRDQAAGQQQRRPARETPPRPDHHHQVEQCGDQHQQVGFPDQRGGGDQQAGHGGRCLADRLTLPHQHDQRDHDQERRADVGEDVLLEVELEGVEQHGDGRQRGQPAPGAEVEAGRVDQHRRGQPEQVLHRHDRRQVVGQHGRDEQYRVAAGAQPVRNPLPDDEVVRVLKVPLAVREDQRLLVGQLDHGAQCGGAHGDDGEQPVLAQCPPAAAGQLASEAPGLGERRPGQA